MADSKKRDMKVRLSFLLCLLIISSLEPEHSTSAAFTFPTKTKSFSTHTRNIPSSTNLYDLSEWRDQFFEVPSQVTNFVKNELSEDKKVFDEPFREICVLPFPLDDVLLQGETKELCLYEDRFHQLFEKATKCHNSVVAMGLLAPPAGILQNMPLCEIENYRVMNGQTAFGTDFSILVTIRVVGRASLMYIQDEDDEMEYLRGWCVEINDEDTGKDIIDVGNKLADKLDGIVTEIQILEEKLMALGSNKIGQDVQAGRSIDVTSEASMKRRILEAEIDDAGSEEEGEDDDDDDEEINDRRQRLKRAFEVAKATDFQGYTISNSDSITVKKSIQDLNALSWAYFCCENNPLDIISYRLRAIESVDVCERMELALSMMKERKVKLTKLLRDSTIDTRNNEDDEDDANLS